MTGAAFTSSDLFNCCANGAAPDFSQFDALEIGGCIDDSDEDMKGRGETYTVGGIERDKAEFFTVYGHFRPGHGQGVDALTDCETFDKAQAVAAELSRLSGLPVHIHC